MNVIEGEPIDRPMTTGLHTVRDIFCVKCGMKLGWKYVCFTSISLRYSDSDKGFQDKAFEANQKYKEGKFILERNLLQDVQ